jgi:uncharacterized membrane-anchored protein YjiN (DUF445 family)
LDRALQAFERWLIANEVVIKAKFSQASLYTPLFVDSYVVERLVEEMISLLHDVAENPKHEMRLAFDRFTADFVNQLEASPEFRRRGQEMLKKKCSRVLY